jgi:hypothetical protein
LTVSRSDATDARGSEEIGGLVPVVDRRNPLPFVGKDAIGNAPLGGDLRGKLPVDSASGGTAASSQQRSQGKQGQAG